MNCPNCSYEDGWDGELLDTVEGESGPFFENPVKMKRGYSSEETLYACPKCGIAFIDRGGVL